MAFLGKKHRNPSKHRIEEHQLLNFVKHNRKLNNKGELKEDTVEMFQKLLEMGGRSIRGESVDIIQK